MNKNTILRSAFIAFCLIGMLVLPAAAAPAGQATGAKVSTVDQGLKDDLWANHQQHRLQRFDLNVQQAESVITILEKYNIDTTACQATLTTISSRRSGLEAALSSRDQTKLKTVNAELKTLRQQFRKEMRDAIKDHYGKGAAGTPAALSSFGLGSLPV
jgi:hypothetical protein